MSKAISANKQLARNILFNSSSFVINLFISFFFTPYLIKVVGKEAYGFFPLANNMIGYTSVLTTALGSMAGRFITMKIYENDRKQASIYFNSVFTANLIFSFVFTLLSFFVIYYLDQIINIPSEISYDIKVLFFFTFGCSIISLATSIFNCCTYIKNRVDLSSSISTLTNIIRVLLILFLFWIFRPSIVYMSLSAFIAALINSYFMISLSKKLLPEITLNPRKFFSWSAVVELTSSGIWNSVNQLSYILLTQIDILIANVFISAMASADYGLAKTVPTLMLSFIAMLSGSFYPYFNILYAQKKYLELSEEIDKSIKFIGVIIGLLIGFLIVFSDVFFNIWLPITDTTMISKLSVISLLPMIIGTSINPIFGIFTITNKLKIPSIVLCISGFANTLIVFILLKYTDLGLWAIALTGAIQQGLRNFIFTAIYGAKILGYKWYKFYKPLIFSIAGLIVVIAISSLLKNIIIIDNFYKIATTFIIVSICSLSINGLICLNKEERRVILMKIVEIYNRIKIT